MLCTVCSEELDEGEGRGGTLVRVLVPARRAVPGAARGKVVLITPQCGVGYARGLRLVNRYPHKVRLDRVDGITAPSSQL